MKCVLKVGLLGCFFNDGVGSLGWGNNNVIYFIFIGGLGGFLGFIVLFFLVKFYCKNEINMD